MKLTRQVDGRGDFGKRGDAGERLDDAVLRHGEVPLFGGQLRYLVLGRIIAEEVGELVVHEDRLVEADAPLVAGLAAIGRAAYRRLPYRFYFFGNKRLVGERLEDFHDHLFLCVRERPLFFLLWVERAQETLRHRDRHGRTEGLRVRVEVCKPREGARRIVGVQGREDEMAGERGLDGDVGRLAVADLADHDDVRVLAHNRAEPLGEG